MANGFLCEQGGIFSGAVLMSQMVFAILTKGHPPFEFCYLCGVLIGSSGCHSPLKPRNLSPNSIWLPPLWNPAAFPILHLNDLLLLQPFPPFYPQMLTVRLCIMLEIQCWENSGTEYLMDCIKVFYNPYTLYTRVSTSLGNPQASTDVSVGNPWVKQLTDLSFCQAQVWTDLGRVISGNGYLW